LNQLPLWTHLIAIIVLLLISGFFSMRMPHPGPPGAVQPFTSGHESTIMG